MPSRVQWNSSYSVRNELLDRQHKDLLAQCNALADCVCDSEQVDELKFDRIFNELMSGARDHFSTESALLGHAGHPLLEEVNDAHDEFEHLATDIITTENFDRIELQRFLSLWWVGHIVGTGKKYRDFLKTVNGGVKLDVT